VVRWECHMSSKGSNWWVTSRLSTGLGCANGFADSRRFSVWMDTPLSRKLHMATAEQRSFKIGPSLLWSTIRNQAGFPAARENAYSDEKKELPLTNRTNTQ
jgi:hypothetical protein